MVLPAEEYHLAAVAARHQMIHRCRILESKGSCHAPNLARADGTWVNAADKPMLLPVDTAAAQAQCLVYDSRAREELTGACSVGADGSNAPYLLFRTAAPHGAISYRHKLARRASGAWDIVDVGPEVEAGFVNFARDDNFQLQVLADGRLRAFVVNTVAGHPTKTDLSIWESRDSGRTWRTDKTIFTSTAYPAEYVLVSPKLVADARQDGFLLFGNAKRYLYGIDGVLKNDRPE